MKLRNARFVGPLAMIAAAAYPMADASPAETTPGTVTPSVATMAAPVQPMSAAEAASTTPAAAPSAPSSGAASAAAAAPAAAPAASAPAAGAPSAPEAKSAEAETFAIRKAARALGLKPHTKGGTEVYCKSSAEIGTRVPTLNCYTKEQVAELQKRTQSNQDDIATMQRASLTEPNGG